MLPLMSKELLPVVTSQTLPAVGAGIASQKTTLASDGFSFLLDCSLDKADPIIMKKHIKRENRTKHVLLSIFHPPQLTSIKERQIM